ncbi:hypothetical protein G7046_g9976 [Stylonectria norvegica]|nr:hypothetical protein G7046_g9976 [Stylonectria norvegica]
MTSMNVVSPAVQHTDDPFVETAPRPSLSSSRARSGSETVTKTAVSVSKTKTPSTTAPPSLPSPPVAVVASVAGALPYQSMPAVSPVVAPISPKSTKSSKSSRSDSAPRSPKSMIKRMSHDSPSRGRSLSDTLIAPMQSLLRGSHHSLPASSSTEGTEDTTNITHKPKTKTHASSGSSASAKPRGSSSSTARPKQAPESPKAHSRFWKKRSNSTSSNNDAAAVASDRDDFHPIQVSIPTESLLEDDFMKSLCFSKRGSIMFGASNSSLALDGATDQHPLDLPGTNINDTTTTVTPTIVDASQPQSQSQSRSSADTKHTDIPETETDARDASSPALMPPPDIRVLAADVEKESRKVRSLYTVGDGPHGETSMRHSYCERLEPTPEAPSEDNDNIPLPGHLSPAWGTPRSGSSFSHSDLPKAHFELAGGLEDWEDIDGADVDRYGFINVPRPGSRVGTPTELKSAQYSPRKRNVLQKRDPSGLSSPLSGRRTPTRKVSARSLNTQASELSMTTSLRSSRSVIRQASNLLPHNRDRRWMDEAGDMVNMSPNLQDIEEEVKAEKITEALKRKEWERSEKWRRMAKVVRKGNEGQGMEFEFDTKNPKLIERTWKGIPDRWRGAAWWSFLATSAKNDNDSATEEVVVAAFHRLQRRSSPDDVQIDLDVPRTISRHIMFRRRYRGGQRLLFRVLHAISIYYPETGYVQGMASLAATLLCYFDEEKCFVMMVRMWQLRGLAKLYRPGFEELMAALEDFSTRWLNKEVASKLTELCIDPTAYGTRWYLTLFNLSIPFGAQLRVWDVFLLLGDEQPSSNEASSQATKPGETSTISTSEYNILHATSAALAQALREVLLDSDFENVMKALTAWIPIKDEDLLMKVTKAEWKTRHSKKKT